MKNKIIYLLGLDHDMGELWLDKKGHLIKWVCSNDANFSEEYHGFIIEHLGGQLVRIDDSCIDYENTEDVYGEDIYYHFKKDILKQIEKQKLADMV